MGARRAPPFCTVVPALLGLLTLADAAPVRIADLSWHSADALGSAFRSLLHARNIEAEISPDERTTSASAADAVRAGELDLVPECWYNCTGPGLVSKLLGVEGLEGFYLPGRLARERPELLDWNASDAGQALRIAGMKLLGAPRQYGASYDHSVALASELGVELETPADETAHLREVLEVLKWQQSRAVYMWEPHVLTSTRDMVRVTLPSEGARWEPIQLSAVWAASLQSQTAGGVLEEVSLPLNNSRLDEMVQSVTEKVSFRLGSSSFAYAAAMESVARDLVCEASLVPNPGDNCQAPVAWPRVKEPFFPERVKVVVKHNEGFVTCKDEGGGYLRRPKGGYSVDHVHEVLRYVGYQRHEVEIECAGDNSVSALIANTSHEMYDIATAAITINSKRQELVDFSSPFFSLGLQLMVAQPTVAAVTWDKVLMMVLPFHWSTWAAIVVFGWLSAFVMRRVEKHAAKKAARERLKRNLTIEALRDRSVLQQIREARRLSDVGVVINELMPTSLGHHPSLNSVEDVADAAKEVASYVAEGLVAPTQLAGNVIVLQEGESVKRTFYGRVYVWLVGTVSALLLMLYEASLTSRLTVQSLEDHDFGSIAELRNHRAALVCDTSVEQYLEEFEPDVRRVCAKDLKAATTMLANREVEAVVYDGPLLKMAASGDCQFLVVGEEFNKQEWGLALPKNHPLTAAVSAATTRLREEGFNSRLEAKYMRNRCEDAPDVEEQVIWPSQLIGLLVITLLAAGVVAARWLWKRLSKKDEVEEVEECAPPTTEDGGACSGGIGERARGRPAGDVLRVAGRVDLESHQGSINSTRTPLERQ